MNRAMRTCTLCDVAYPAGTYAEHARHHKPLRASRAGRSKGATDPTRAAAIALAVAEGVRTLEAIGADYGITRERVRQIAQREGVTRAWQPVPGRPRFGPRTRCLTCDQMVPAGAMRPHRIAAGHTPHASMRLTNNDLVLVRSFYERGLGYKAIGDAMGVDHMSIKRAVIGRLGLSPHPVGQYPRDGSGRVLRVELASRLRGLSA